MYIVYVYNINNVSKLIKKKEYYLWDIYIYKFLYDNLMIYLNMHFIYF